MDYDKIYREIGQRIRDVRESRKMKQAELAELLGLTRTSVTNIERGKQKITLDSLYALCQRFGLEAQDLLPAVPSTEAAQSNSVIVAGREYSVDAKVANSLSRLRPKKTTRGQKEAV